MWPSTGESVHGCCRPRYLQRTTCQIYKEAPLAHQKMFSPQSNTTTLSHRYHRPPQPPPPRHHRPPSSSKTDHLTVESTADYLPSPLLSRYRLPPRPRQQPTTTTEHRRSLKTPYRTDSYSACYWDHDDQEYAELTQPLHNHEHKVESL